MKLLSTTALMIVFTAQLFGQENFSVEGTTVKTGSIVKTYNFYYQVQDSISLFFSDSTITFTNPSQIIKNEITYSSTYKETYTKIQYFRKNSKDSISKHFNGDKLNMIYTTRFDKQDRIVYYALKDFRANSTHDPGFEWFYEYHDSLISTGKIVIQTIFVDDAYGDKRFHFRVLYEYDSKNREVKEKRESKLNDPMAQITTYKYDTQDSLIEENVVGIGNMLQPNKYINTSCDMEIDKAFTVTNFSDYNSIIKQLLFDHKKELTSNKCENFICSYISPDKHMKVILRKVKPYWEGGRNVSVIVTKSYLWNE